MNNKTREKMRRILAIIMAVTMIISVAGSLIYYLAMPTFALDADAPAYEAHLTVRGDYSVVE